MACFAVALQGACRRLCACLTAAPLPNDVVEVCLELAVDQREQRLRAQVEEVDDLREAIGQGLVHLLQGSSA